LEPAIARLGSERLPHLSARALLVTAMCLRNTGSYALCQVQLSEGLDIARRTGDLVLTAEALTGLSHLAQVQGDLTDALEMAQEAVEIATSTDDLSVAADAFGRRGSVRSELGLSGARTDLEEALARFITEANVIGAAHTLNGLAVLELKRGNVAAATTHLNDHAALVRAFRVEGIVLDLFFLIGLVNILTDKPSVARQAFGELLAISRRIGIQALVGHALIGLGFCANAANEYRRAAMLQGAGDAIFEKIGVVLDAGLQGLRELDGDRLRHKMGADAFDSAYQAGRNLAPRDAVALALEETDYNQVESTRGEG
jgi:hypothetical protein